MDFKNPPLLKWYDPGPLEEPSEIAEVIDALGHRDILPKEKEDSS